MKKKKCKIKNIVLVSLIVIVVSLVYSNHFNNPFAFDDFHTIKDNIVIKNIANYKLFFEDASSFSSNPSNQMYRPLISLSSAIDYYIANGENPFYFHLSMFIIFLIQLILMFFVIKYLLAKISEHYINDYLTFFIVLFYGLHTANAETLNYISSRSDSYSTFFVVLSFFIYFYFPKIRRFQLFLIPLVLGSLCKEQAVMFLPIFFVYILIFEEDFSLNDIFTKKAIKPIRNTIVKTLPSIIVCAVIVFIIFRMQGENMVTGGNSRFYYFITQAWVYLRYFIAFFLPINLSADTDWTAFTNVFDERAIVGYLFIILIIILIIKTSNQQRTKSISFGLSWFLLSLLPTSSIIPLAEVTNDHRMFFPFVGLCIAGVTCLKLLFIKYENMFKQKKVIMKLFVIFLGVVILGFNAYGVRKRNVVWSSYESLWYDVTIKSPHNGRGLMNYGLSQMRLGNYDIALEYFNRALIYTPNYSYLHTNLGTLYSAMGNFELAESYFKKGIYLGDNIYITHYLYAKFLNENKRYSEALYEAETARSLSPNYLLNIHLLYEIYYNLNKISDLIDLVNNTLNIYPTDEYSIFYKNLDYSQKANSVYYAEQLVKTNPSAENYLNLSLEYYNLGDYEKCIEACYKSLEIKPDYSFAYNNICSAYNALGKYAEAIQACEKALEIDSSYVLAQNNLQLAKQNFGK